MNIQGPAKVIEMVEMSAAEARELRRRKDLHRQIGALARVAEPLQYSHKPKDLRKLYRLRSKIGRLQAQLVQPRLAF